MYISNTGRGNGATGVHRAFSDGYQGESIEHSLMDPEREGGAQNSQQYVLLETYMLAFASRIIVGVLAKQSMSAPTNNQCQLHQNNQCQLQQMRNTACLLCNCQSDYRRRTGKTINVSINKQSMSGIVSFTKTINASFNK